MENRHESTRDGGQDTPVAVPDTLAEAAERPGPPARPAPAEQPRSPEQPGSTAQPGPAEQPGPAAQPGPAEQPEGAGQPEALAQSGDAPAPPEPPAEAPDGDHEQLLVRDLEELAAKAEKADEYLELAKRTKADFENYRKRAAREAAAAQERGIAKLAKELLPAVDNLDRAVQASESAGSSQADGTLASGIKLVQADVLAALQRAGIERYSPEGEPFDPQRHEAIAQMPVEGAEPGTIVEVYQQGYLLGEAVIRPARVVVAG